MTREEFCGRFDVLMRRVLASEADVARTLRVPVATVRRWRNRESAPQQLGRLAAFRALDRMQKR